MAKQLGGCERISGQKDKKDLLQLGGVGIVMVCHWFVLSPTSLAPNQYATRPRCFSPLLSRFFGPPAGPCAGL